MLQPAQLPALAPVAALSAAAALLSHVCAHMSATAAWHMSWRSSWPIAAKTGSGPGQIRGCKCECVGREGGCQVRGRNEEGAEAFVCGGESAHARTPTKTQPPTSLPTGAGSPHVQKPCPTHSPPTARIPPSLLTCGQHAERLRGVACHSRRQGDEAHGGRDELQVAAAWLGGQHGDAGSTQGPRAGHGHSQLLGQHQLDLGGEQLRCVAGQEGGEVR